MKKELAIMVFSWLPLLSFGQLGGQKAYSFLQLAPTARAASLGGLQIAVRDADGGLGWDNLAALNSATNQHLSFQSGFIAPGIYNGTVGYAHHLNKRNISLHGGIQFLQYGKFTATDDTGAEQGTFRAADYNLSAGVAGQLSERLSYGLRTKLLLSQYESYRSAAGAIDASAMYNDTASLFTAAFVMKNMGVQFSSYADTKEKLPFEIQFGVSKRLRYLPFRLSITLRNLQRWGIRYDDPNAPKTTNILGEEVTENQTKVWLDNAFRHFVFGGEFLLGKRENFRLRLGYTHLRRAELLVESTRGLSGFTVGAGIKIKQFRLDYAHEFRHWAGGSNSIGISTLLTDFK